MTKKYSFLLSFSLLLSFLIIIKSGVLVNIFRRPVSFLEINTDKIEKIEISKESQKTILKKTRSGWVVATERDFPAKNEEIKNLLSGFDQADNPEVVSENKEKYSLFKLDDKNGIKVKILSKGDSFSYIFGKNNSAYTGVYFRFEKKTPVFLIKTDILYLLDDFDYRDLDLIKIDKEKITKLTFQYPDNRFILEKTVKDKKENWIIEGLSQDNDKVKDYLSLITDLQADDGLVKQEKADYGFSTPSFVLEIEESKKKISLISGYPETAEENEFNVTVSNRPYIYLISRETLSALQKQAGDFQSP